MKAKERDIKVMTPETGRESAAHLDNKVHKDTKHAQRVDATQPQRPHPVPIRRGGGVTGVRTARLYWVNSRENRGLRLPSMFGLR